MVWQYYGKDFTELPKEKYGFVYIIEYESGKKYIGKKSFYSVSVIEARKDLILRDGAVRIYRNILRGEDGKIAVTKKDKAKARKLGLKAKRTAYDSIIKESNWRTYNGSCDNIEKGDNVVKKNIVMLANSQQHLSYLETKLQFSVDAGINEAYYNKCIGGSYYDNVERVCGEYLKYKGVEDE